jgi:hypothetical protein
MILDRKAMVVEAGFLTRLVFGETKEENRGQEKE